MEFENRVASLGNANSIGIKANPIDLERHIGVLWPWAFPADPNYRIEIEAPDTAHTIVATEGAFRVWISSVRPFVYERVHFSCPFADREQFSRLAVRFGSIY